jgi:tRNA U34 5-methylaminomethyl-2-thiouridine-forming methyltransferase MnmC
MKMKRKIITTADGSKTIHLPDWNENYHSNHGALQEAKHVFIQHGFEFLASTLDQISILEVGFGTGLNAILTLEAAEKFQLKTEYIGVEAFPVSETEIEALNYIDLFEKESLKTNYKQLHTIPWDEKKSISTYFQLEKKETKIEQLALKSNSLDLIYFDAFGPRVQSELWEIPIFESLFKALKPAGTLVTYCAKGQVKRNLKSVGFNIESLPGPPGKREMTRATKPNEH